MKIIINENQRGLLFKNGKFIDVLYCGKHSYFGNSYKVNIACIDREFRVDGFCLETFIANQKLAKELEVIDVKDETIALHYVDGKFKNCLKSGKYAYFNIVEKHTFKEISITNLQVGDDIPKYIFNTMDKDFYFKIIVLQYQKARLYFDGKFIGLLDEGTYYFWNNGTKINAEFVDTRMLQIDIQGQEILTLDKVTLRINLVCHYKISDYIKIHSEIQNFEEQIHVNLQLALREYIGKYRLDEVLENKEEISRFVFQKIKEKQDEFFINIIDAGIKDIILPGEIREIMNTVLIAEKKAQANVITRREEVASTRSLLNTAKLMEENATLYKLKEMEYLEKICENVGNISVGSGADLLTQLNKVLKG